LTAVATFRFFWQVTELRRLKPMKRVGRSTFRKLYWGPLLFLVVVFMLSAMVLPGIGGSQPCGPLEHLFLIVLVLAFLSWLFLGPLISRPLVPLFVSTISCPGCGEEIEALGLWDCACGFHDYRETHVLAGYCPSCGAAAGHLSCPRCGCTILLW
jgi:hypothetical protein